MALRVGNTHNDRASAYVAVRARAPRKVTGRIVLLRERDETEYVYRMEWESVTTERDGEKEKFGYKPRTLGVEVYGTNRRWVLWRVAGSITTATTESSWALE